MQIQHLREGPQQETYSSELIRMIVTNIQDMHKNIHFVFEQKKPGISQLSKTTLKNSWEEFSWRLNSVWFITQASHKINRVSQIQDSFLGHDYMKYLQAHWLQVTNFKM